MDNQRVHYILHCPVCSFSYQNDRLALNHLLPPKKLEHLKVTFLTINIFFFPANIFFAFTVICLILSFHIVNIFSALMFGLGMTKDCQHLYTLHVVNFHQQIEQEKLFVIVYGTKGLTRNGCVYMLCIFCCFCSFGYE